MDHVPPSQIPGLNLRLVSQEGKTGGDEDLVEQMITQVEQRLVRRSAGMKADVLAQKLQDTTRDTALGFFDLDSVGRGLQLSQWDVYEYVEALTEIARTGESDKIRMAAMERLISLCREAAVTNGVITKTVLRASTPEREDGSMLSAEHRTVSLVREGIKQNREQIERVMLEQKGEDQGNGANRNEPEQANGNEAARRESGDGAVENALGHRPPDKETNDRAGGICRPTTPPGTL